MYLAQVWSLTNKYADTPYLISREQRKKGFEYKCTCPFFVNRHRSCKHISAVLEAMRIGENTDNVKFLIDVRKVNV